MPSSRRQSQKAFSRARAGSQNLARVFSRRSYVHSCSLSRRKCRERLPEKRFALTKVVRRFVCNQQYSIIALTNGGGTVTERYAYDAYGTPTVTDAAATVLTSSADNNRYTYTGREFDEALGLYHYRARMYDSVAGRFCSRDPIGFEGSKWNLYEYASSGPHTRVDPSGKTWLDIFNPWRGPKYSNCPPIPGNRCKGFKDFFLKGCCKSCDTMFPENDPKKAAGFGGCMFYCTKAKNKKGTTPCKWLKNHCAKKLGTKDSPAPSTVDPADIPTCQLANELCGGML